MSRLADFRAVAHDAWIEAGGCESCHGFGLFYSGVTCHETCTAESVGPDPAWHTARLYDRISEAPRASHFTAWSSQDTDMRRGYGYSAVARVVLGTRETLCIECSNPESRHKRLCSRWVSL